MPERTVGSFNPGTTEDDLVVAAMNELFPLLDGETHDQRLRRFTRVKVAQLVDEYNTRSLTPADAETILPD